MKKKKDMTNLRKSKKILTLGPRLNRFQQSLHSLRHKRHAQPSVVQQTQCRNTTAVITTSGWLWDAQTNQWVPDPNYVPTMILGCLMANVKPGVQERILLHLLDYSDYKNSVEVPFSLSQMGIANAVAIARSNVPRQ